MTDKRGSGHEVATGALPPSARSGSGETAGRNVSGGPAKRAGARVASSGGSRATAPEASPSAAADGWAQAHRVELGRRERSARLAAQRSGKPWTLHADEQTRRVLAECPARKLSPATTAKYRRAYDGLHATGRTPLEAAGTAAHYAFLLTAFRYCAAADVRAHRAASERAMKRGDLASAQRRTERAWQLATVLDQTALQPDRPTWGSKPAAERKPSKSKRHGPRAPTADNLLLAMAGWPERVRERHALRAPVLALFGMRPEELRLGVSLRVVQDQRGRDVLAATIRGAKVNGTNRGQEARRMEVLADTPAARFVAAHVRALGGRTTMATTDADIQSLNGALAKACPGLSCYSFRHALGSELKEKVATGSLAATEAAQAMGHRSTRSLVAYGKRSHARGGRKLRATASDAVRSVPVTFAAKAAARAARAAKAAKAPIGAAPRPAASAPPTPRAAMSKPVGPLAKGPRPPGR